MSDTRELVDAIISGKTIDIEKSFESVMADKVSAKLDDMRTEYAKGMFAGVEEGYKKKMKEEDDMDDEDEDEDEDDDKEKMDEKMVNPGLEKLAAQKRAEKEKKD